LRDLRQQRVFLKSEGILMHCTLTIKYLTTSTIPRQGADSFGVRQPSSVKIAFGNRCAMICFGDNETSVTRGPVVKKTLTNNSNHANAYHASYGKR